MKKLLLAIPVGIPSAIVLALILYLSLAGDPLGGHDIMLFPGADKVAHVIMYLGATLVFICDYAKFRLPHHSRIDKELAITAASIMLGLLMEMAQLLMSNGRSYDIRDWYADIVGALLAFAFYRLWLMHAMRVYLFHSLHRHHHHHRHHHATPDEPQVA